MQENYSGSRNIRKLSKAEIKKMKENMQKTPLIQEKADHYHRKEVLEAENLIEKVESSSPNSGIEVKDKKQEEKVGFFQKLKTYLFG